jgi:hypothetical protein
MFRVIEKVPACYPSAGRQVLKLARGQRSAYLQIETSRFSRLSYFMFRDNLRLYRSELSRSKTGASLNPPPPANGL